MRAKLSVLPGAVVKLVDLFNPLARELGEMFYKFERPYVPDGSDFAKTFGFSPTPHANAVRETLAWFRARDAKIVP